MNRRRDSIGSSGISLGRLFFGTALVAIIFSVGIIVGQHLLLKDDLAPVVSVGEEQKSAPEAEGDEPVDEASDRPEIFSFYDVLTAPEVVDSPLPTLESMDDEGAAAPPEEILASGGGTVGHSHGDFDFDSAAPQTDDGSPPARFTLQVASHASRERARTEMDRLRRMGLDPHLVAVDVDDHGKHYRVRIGKFPTDAAARGYRSRLSEEHNLHAFITPL